MKKTKSRKDQDHYLEEHREWAIFQPRLAAANSFGEAIIIVHEGPGRGSPGSKYYENLGYFLGGGYHVPIEANQSERNMYIELIKRLEASGDLVGSADEISARLKG